MRNPSKSSKSRILTALLLSLYLSSPFLVIIPISVSATQSPPVEQGDGTTSLPPGTVTNKAAWNGSSPACPRGAGGQALINSSSWSKTLVVPTVVLGGQGSGLNITQTFAVGSNGTFSTSDAFGNSFRVMPPTAGLPNGTLSISLKSNSTMAVQTFVVHGKKGMLANIAVTYKVRSQQCLPAGLKITISGTVNWKKGSGTISIPFATSPMAKPMVANGTSAAPPPMRMYFGSKGRESLGFDWSDSEALNPTYNPGTNSLTYNVGTTFTIDPKTIGTTNSVQALGDDYQDHICNYGGRTWIFYFDGTNFGWQSSTDGIIWTTETVLQTGGTKAPANLAITCDGIGNVAYSDGLTGTSKVYGAKGTLDPADGSITGFNPSGGDTYFTLTTGNLIYPQGISMTWDGPGWPSTYPNANTFVVVDTRNSSGGFHVEVYKCPYSGSGCWTNILNLPESTGYMSNVLVSLGGGKMALVGAEDGNLGAKIIDSEFFDFYSGSSWLGVVHSGIFAYFFKSSCVPTSGAVLKCFIPYVGDYTDSNGAANLYSIPYGSTSWPSPMDLGTLNGHYYSASEGGISTDGKSELYVSWKDDLSSTVIYMTSTDGGNTWGIPWPITYDATGTGAYYETMTTGDAISLTAVATSVWLQGLGSYNIQMAQAGFNTPPTPPWGGLGLSPYGTFVNNAVVYVSLGTGLVTVEQSLFNLPGRGLSLAPALIYQEPTWFASGAPVPYSYSSSIYIPVGQSGWELNLPWLNGFLVGLPDGEQYGYNFGGSTQMFQHGPVDFELDSTAAGGGCPCTLYLPSGLTYAFDSGNKLTSETDSSGNRITFAYDSTNRINLITDTIGRSVILAYGSNGYLSTITAPPCGSAACPSGTKTRVWTFGYNYFAGLANLGSLTDTLGNVESFGYVSDNPYLLSSVTFFHGGKVTLAYGLAGAQSGAVSFLVTSRSVFKNTATITQSDSFSYLVIAGALTWVNETEADGSGNVQGYVKNFYSGSTLEKGFFVTSAGAVNRIYESNFGGGRLTYLKTENGVGAVLASSAYSYDEWGNVVSLADNMGHQTWMSYFNTVYQNAFTTSTCSASGFYSNSMALTIHDRLVGVCTFSGGIHNYEEESFYSYSPQAQLIQSKVANGSSWISTTYTPDSFGNIIKVHDADNHYVYYHYGAAYGHAYLTSTSQVVGGQNISTSYAYDYSTGFVTSVKDPNGFNTSSTYDPLGRTLSTTSPPVNGVSSVFKMAYDDKNVIITLTDPMGNQTKEHFDGLSRMTAVQRLNGTSTVYSNTFYTYSWMDKLASEQIPSSPACPGGCTYRFSYDIVGRPTKETFPDSNFVLYTYNDVSNTVTVTDPNGYNTVYSYDWNGRLTSVQVPIASGHTATTSYYYDGLGDQTSVTDGIGRTTNYDYNNLNRLDLWTYPDGNFTRYSYDSIGNLHKLSKADGTAISYSYDEADRLKSIRFPSGKTTSFIYDQDGNVKTATTNLEATNTETYTYDPMDRLSTSALTIGGSTYTTQYSYNRDSAVTKVVYPDGLAVNMKYDAVNRLRKVVGYAAFAYNKDNTVASITFGDGEVQSYTYDNRMRPTNIIDAKSGTTYLALNPVSYDAASNTKAMTVNGNAESFGYDQSNRLTMATGPWGSTGYNYDASNNIIQTVNGTGTTGYSNCGYYNPPTGSTTTITCALDKNGNIISKTGGWSYTYDYADQLSGVSQNGNQVTTNTYDGEGNMVERSDANEVFTYNGANMLFLKAIPSGPTEDFVYGNGMLLAEVIGSATYYVHSDPVTNVRLITYSASGTVHTSFQSDYQSYGTNYGAAGTSLVQFAGKTNDPHDGLYYMGARTYDPTIMRFLSKDPIQANDYTYANNNPMSNVDPTGLETSVRFNLLAAPGMIWNWLTGGGCDQGCQRSVDENLWSSLVMSTPLAVIPGISDFVAGEADAAAAGAVDSAVSQGASDAAGVADTEAFSVSDLLSMSGAERSQATEEHLADIYSGTTKVPTLFTEEGTYRMFDVKTKLGTYLEMKFGGDTIRPSEIEKDLSFLRNGGSVYGPGYRVEPINIMYVFISDPVTGAKVSQDVLDQLDQLGIQHQEWGWEFWNTPAGSFG